MKILLHSNQLSLGGTEVALWDYACGCKDILKHEVIVASMAGGLHNKDIITKFSSRFDTILYQPGELPTLARGVDVAYFITDGQRNEGLLIPEVKNVIHAVFAFNEPHGDVYAYVSEWLSEVTTGGQAPWVPHIVKPLKDGAGNLRGWLGIPEGAIVFGGYGRRDQFSIPFVRDTVERIASSRPDLYFVFMNFDLFTTPRKNLIFISGSHEEEKKAAFIDTCDAMLHARIEGETFGLAVAEFSVRNKPVITYGQSQDRAHMFVLGERALVYNDTESLTRTILNFRPSPTKDWNAYRDFNPENVMHKFDQVFLRI